MWQYVHLQSPDCGWLASGILIHSSNQLETNASVVNIFMCSIFVCEGVLSPHSINVEGITSVCPIFAIYYYFV